MRNFHHCHRHITLCVDVFDATVTAREACCYISGRRPNALWRRISQSSVIIGRKTRLQCFHCAERSFSPVMRSLLCPVPTQWEGDLNLAVPMSTRLSVACSRVLLARLAQRYLAPAATAPKSSQVYWFNSSMKLLNCWTQKLRNKVNMDKQSD